MRQIAINAGATATFSNKAPLEEQLELIEALTDGGIFWHVFDASAQSFDLSIKALDTVSRAETLKYFSTVDDWYVALLSHKPLHLPFKTPTPTNINDQVRSQSPRVNPDVSRPTWETRSF